MVLLIQRPPDLKNPEIPDRTNQLLGLLPELELQNLLVSSERIILPAKQNLHKFNEPIEQVYFPLQGIISLVNTSEDGLSAEVATVSNEGMIGIAGFLGGNISASLAITRTTCTAISMPVNVFRRESTNGKKLQRILLLYTQALLTKVSRNVFCSCHHTLEQRLARWLLSYSDRLHGKTLLLTQETLADLLGVRRSSLSVVAVDFKQRNLIRYNRGRVTIINYEGLKQVSCRCERSISREYTRLLNCFL